MLLIVTAGLCLGLWRGADYMQSLAVYSPLYGRKLTVHATVMNDGNYNKYKQMSFEVNNARTADGQRLPGKISISGFGMNSVYYGDDIVIVGKLQSTLGAAQGRMSFAQLQLVRNNPSYIGDIRRNFAAGLQTALPEPVASFALGILIGQRATMPPETKDALMRVGLMHIIAVSGFNLTIILRASKRLLSKQSKRLSTGLAVGLIVTFLLITGFSASIVRAAIISGLSIFASYYGRTFRPLLLIVLVAAGTAFWNPVYIWSDAGWYLSFLAFAGVIILGPLLASRFPQWVQNSPVLMIPIESFAAEMATLPYLLHTFGQMSFVGLIANTLIAAFIPIAMLLSAVAGIVGMVAAPIVGWIAWPAVAVMTYMLDVAQILSKLPGAFRENLQLSQIAALQLYGVVLLVWAGLHFKTVTKAGIITDKKPSFIPEHERIHIV